MTGRDALFLAPRGAGHGNCPERFVREGLFNAVSQVLISKTAGQRECVARSFTA